MRPVDQKGEEGPIDEIKTPDEIRAEPYKLPTGFKWVDIELNDEKDVCPHSLFIHLDSRCLYSSTRELRRR